MVFSFPTQRRVKSLTTSASACSISFRLASSAKRRPASRKAAMTRRLWPTTWNTVNPAVAGHATGARGEHREKEAGARVWKPRHELAADDDARAWNLRLTYQDVGQALRDRQMSA